MGKEEIIKKLKRFLDKRNTQFNNEPDVVYFLAEIRKVLEQRGEKFDLISDDPYGILRFYIDWALHSKKDRSFIEEVKEVAKLVSGKKMGSEEALGELMNWFLDCNPLKENLKEFLSEHGLPLDLVKIDHLWQDFAEEHYVSVISDQDIIVPLKNRIAVITINKKRFNIRFSVERKSKN